MKAPLAVHFQVTDCYPFGMIMPGRNYSAGTKYRYGFNGKEKDTEGPVQYDYGFRIYDPTISKFLSVDPLTSSYPFYSPYQFSSNSPLANIDMDGLECWAVNPSTGQTVSGPLYMPHFSKNDGWITGAYSSSSPAPIAQPQTQKGPILPVFSESSVQSKIIQQRKIAMAKAPPKPFVAPQASTISQDNLSRDYHERLNSYYRHQEEETNLVSQAMETPEGQGGYGAALTFYQIARTPVTIYEHGSQLVQNMREGNYWAAGGNALLLGLDVAPFVGGDIPEPSPSLLPSRLARVIDENVAGSSTLGASNQLDVFVTDAADLNGLTTSSQIAEKLTLTHANGQLRKGPFRIIEFDTPSSGLSQPYNRTTPGFINGGKTAGGATEYIIPNVNINTLQNVTQKTIR